MNLVEFMLVLSFLLLVLCHGGRTIQIPAVSNLRVGITVIHAKCLPNLVRLFTVNSNTQNNMI